MSNYEMYDSHPGVLAYIEVLQGIISRMATNSANCKTWAVSIIVAVMALSNYSGWQRFGICIGPIIIMMLLDAFYLGLERRFKNIYILFIKQINSGESPVLFEIPSASLKENLCGMIKGLVSLSTTPFYILIALIPFVFIFVTGAD